MPQMQVFLIETLLGSLQITSNCFYCSQHLLLTGSNFMFYNSFIAIPFLHIILSSSINYLTVLLLEIVNVIAIRMEPSPNPPPFFLLLPCLLTSKTSVLSHMINQTFLYDFVIIILIDRSMHTFSSNLAFTGTIDNKGHVEVVLVRLQR